MNMNMKAYSILVIALLSMSSAVANDNTNKESEHKECDAWKNFVKKSKKNVLLDFSYAGYKHGEVEAPKIDTLGYKVFNITEFGATANDGVSDRKAFIDAVAAAKKNGNGIIFFPKGRFILHDSSDDIDGTSRAIEINMGNLILKGEDRHESIIVMKDVNLPTDPKKMWTSPGMIMIKHNRGLGKPTAVTGNAKKGGFSIEVESIEGIKVGDWVCLSLKNNDPKLVAQELAPYQVLENMTSIINKGVSVTDYHQVTRLVKNTITFKEPIMHEVDSKWGWKVSKFYAYENVGVEDLTFEGNCKENFVHHGTWEDDGAFKPINIMRLTNSWVRRVTFLNVSEAMSVMLCANVSVYDISIKGRRGHSAIRSQGSSRVFLGKVTDDTNGRLHDGSGDIENAGQFHGCGVSKESMGAVLWNVSWGDDACFEAHSSQPRATLFDNCKGGFMKGRAGGALSEMPNHLADLTMWNFHATNSAGDDFLWWELENKWWKCLPPVIIGFHGAKTSFVQEQVKYEEGTGKKVYPESLYEAQLKLRLGYVPLWLEKLK